MELIDKNIAEKIAKDNGLSITKLGLRFDKVVVRLLYNLRYSLNKDIPIGKVVLLTITAPIKLPIKTEIELCHQIRKSLNLQVRNILIESTVFQNNINIKIIDVPLEQVEKVVGFIHNREFDSRQLIDLAENWILKK